MTLSPATVCENAAKSNPAGSAGGGSAAVGSGCADSARTGYTILCVLRSGFCWSRIPVPAVPVGRAGFNVADCMALVFLKWLNLPVGLTDRLKLLLFTAGTPSAKRRITHAGIFCCRVVPRDTEKRAIGPARIGLDKMARRERLHIRFDADKLPLIERAAQLQGFASVQTWGESVMLLHAKRVCDLADSDDAQRDEFGRLMVPPQKAAS